MGYNQQFLGVDLPLPVARPQRAGDILRRNTLKDKILADYPNYALVTDAAKRAPLFVVQEIDQKQLQHTERSNRWRLDSRIGAENQLDNAYYANNPWDKGHMAQRESAGWGASPKVAQEASDETFYYANACLQHECLNQDEWLALEDWAQHLDKAKDGKVVVFSGPIFGDYSRTIRPEGRTPAEIPSAFFKVVCFVGIDSGELEVRAFMMQQDKEALRDKDGRKTFNFQKYQVTIREIEEVTGLDFPDDVYEKNPLYYYDHAESRAHGVTVFPERLDVDRPEDVIGRGHGRKAVRDDEVQVYLAAAQIAPKDGTEWVSVLNLEPMPVDLEGWTLRDRANRKTTLAGVLQPGEAKVLRTGNGLDPVKLPNKGGLLILRNAADEQVDRVEYTEDDVKRWEKDIGSGKPVFFPTYRSA